MIQICNAGIIERAKKETKNTEIRPIIYMRVADLRESPSEM